MTHTRASRFFSRIFRRRESTTTTEVAAETQPSVTVIDVGTAETERIGGITVVGAGGLATGGRSGGAGTITQIDPGITVQQAQEVTGGVEVSEEIAREAGLEQTRGETITAFAARGQIGPEQQTPVTQQALRVVDPQTGEERFFQGGREVGRIVVDPQTGERSAIVQQPGTQLQFRDPRTGTVQSLILGEEGFDIIDRTAVSIPSPFDDPISDAERIRLERLDRIAERQNLPLGERLGLAYRSAAPTEGPSIRGGLRAFTELTSFAGERIGIIPTGERLERLRTRTGIISRPVSTRIFEDIALSTFFLGPTTPTTTQLTRELGEVGRVTIVGVTQAIGTRAARTDALFRATRTGRTVRGGIRTDTVVIGSRQGIDTAISGTRGRIFQRVLGPLGRISTRLREQFTVAELTRIRQRDALVIGTGRGIFQRAGERITFRSAGIGERVGSLFGQIGVSIPSRGPGTISTGLFRIRFGTPPPTTFIPGVGPRAITIQTTPATLASAQASASAVREATRISTTLIPRAVTNIVAVTIGATALTAAQRTQQQIQTVSALPRITERVRSVEIPTQRVSLRQAFVPTQRISQVITPRQISRTRQDTRQIQIQIQPQIQVQIPAQVPIQRVRTFELQRFFTSRPQRIFAPRIPIRIRPPRTPIIFPPLRSREEERIRGPSFPVFLRRRGQFRIIGFGRTAREAVSIGTRAAATTLAATFKVPGVRPIRIPGFTTRQTRRGTLFIEQPRLRLSTGSEVLEIQRARRRSR